MHLNKYCQKCSFILLYIFTFSWIIGMDVLLQAVAEITVNNHFSTMGMKPVSMELDKEGWQNKS